MCTSNYSTHDGLVNGANGIFQALSKLPNSLKVIWILFNNPKSGQLTWTKNAHFYEHKIHPTWTPIEPIFKDIQVGSNSTHIITRMQFPMQLATTHTIYWAQGLTFDHLSFDLNGIYKHGLTYITLSHIKNKENLYLQPLQMKNLQIDPNVAIEMHWLQTTTQWDVLIPTPHTLCHSHVLICSLNIKSLSLHKNDV